MTDPTPTERIDEMELLANIFEDKDKKWLLPYARLGAMVVEDRVVLRNAAIEIPGNKQWYKTAICKITDEAKRIAAERAREDGET